MLILRVDRSTSTETVRAPRNGYFNVKVCAIYATIIKSGKKSFNVTKGQCFWQACWRKAEGQCLIRPQRSYRARFKIPGVVWQYFSEPQRWLEIILVAAEFVGKFGRILGVWWQRCLIHDGDQGRHGVCWRYLVGDHVGWCWFWRRGGELHWWERTIGPGPTYVADIWLGSMSVWDIWVYIDVVWGRWCPWLESWGGHAMLIRRYPVDGLDDIFVSR